MNIKIQKIITTMIVLAFVTGCFAAMPLVNAAPHQQHGHNHSPYRIGTVAPTCTLEGYTFKELKATGERWYSDYVPAIGHDFGELDYSQSRYPNVPQIADPVAECLRCGWRGYICIWTETVVEPTCVADGYTQYENQFGWTTAVYDYGSAFGHTWGDFDYSQGRVPFADPVATCETCGWYGYIYSWTITTVEPTCTADGYTEYERSDDWMGWIYDEGSALGHDFGDVIWDGFGWWSGACKSCGWAGYLESEVAVSAFVTKLNGNTNGLTITVTNTYDEANSKTFTETFSINNNSAGTFAVGPYNVYVDTYGNDKIRACYIV
ncbi:MAG: hypothetical protein FWE56_00245 [Candidatus Bathyarchaeota archaeon]|nr:hypothetical protein [Candidatus Termiticorpusculum sp.]